MTYIISSIIYYIKYGFSKSSIASLFFLLLIISSIAAFITGRLFELSGENILSEIYISILLYILFISWNNYRNVSKLDISDINLSKLIKVEKLLIFINSSIFIINVIVFVAVFSLLSSGLIEVNDYKNGGEGYMLISKLVPSYLVTLSNILSPLGYFSLSMHFFYLIKCNYYKAIFHLFLSLNIVLVSLFALSRSALVCYIIIYFFMLMFYLPLLNKRKIKKVMLSVLLAGSFMGVVFASISNNRFGEKYNIESKPLIDPNEYPQLVSYLDYFSQWEYFGPKIMEKYKFGEISWGMYNSFGLGVQIQQKIYGGVNVNEQRDKYYRKILGDDISAFHGNIARCIFDFGYSGTIIFILLNCYYNRKLGPKNKIIYYKTILALPLLLPFSVNFFTGNNFSQLPFNMAVIYSLIIYRILKQNKQNI